MKRIFLLVVACSLICGSAFADDYFRIKVDSVVKGTQMELDFWILRECPTPANITGASNGFIFTDNGSGLTWTWDQGAVQDGGSSVNWSLGFFYTPQDVDGTPPDSILTGGAAIPPAGFPVIGAEEVYFDVLITMANQDGQICVDSAFIPDAGTWKWSGMTCGGGAGERPGFHDIDNANGSPFCIEVYTQLCNGPTINQIPAGDQLVGNHCNGLSFVFDADPGDVGGVPALPLTWSVTSGPGGFTGAEYSVGPMATGSYPVEIQVLNDCGETDTYAFTLVYQNTEPEFTNCSGMPPGFSTDQPYVFDFDAVDYDECDNLSYSVLSIDPAPQNFPTIDENGLFEWQTESPGDDDKTFAICLEVNDGEGGSDQCCFEVIHIPGSPFQIQVEKVHDQYQGHYANVSIFLNKGGEYFGGFDFLVAYDESGLSLVNAGLGEFLNGCWEYFAFRHGWGGNCDGPCQSGMARLVGIADMNNGAYHPDPSCLHKTSPDYIIDLGLGTQEELAVLTFYVTNDRSFDCMYLPVRFYWHDCGDNAISNTGGDTLWISRNVYTYELTDVTGMIYYGGHWWLGNCQNPDPSKPSPMPYIDFVHGGVDIVCSDSIDLRGDMNLNSVPNEIADAVLYTNYFIYGLGVFDVNLEGQIAASDINNDGRVLTVGDLVYLVRIITGDALPFPKLSPFGDNATVYAGENVTIESDVDIGAALFVFDGAADVNLLADGMKMKADVVDGQTRVLVWSDNSSRISSGTSDVLSNAGYADLVDVSVSDYEGNEMNVDVLAKTLPTTFTLKQNYPNPFNPTTDINIDLPTESAWKLDIYNVAGQMVKSFSGYDVGTVTVTWDASDAASGVYFYKATDGITVQTRKMILMK